MNIKICKLTSNMTDEYIDYFDNRAFSDGNINKGCYCVWHLARKKYKSKSMIFMNE